MHKNNFDLIRLFAALQVAVIHISTHLNIKSIWLDALSIFPGVPIFFFISGFLIFQSWANIQEMKYFSFFKNRFLRIYPGLYFCIALTVASLFLSGFLSPAELIHFRLWGWILSQITAFQFFNPEFLSNYGIGVVNGSLWTISVELQFYLLTPIIFSIMQKSKTLFTSVVALLFVINIANTYFNPLSTIPQKIISVSFLPWLGMFMVGAYFSTSQKLQAKILQTPWTILALLYLLIYLLAVHWGGAKHGNGINPILYLILSAIILKAALSKPSIAEIILRKNDISYGVYIYHMPILNLLIYFNLKNSTGFWIAILGTILFSLISWKLIEKPALRLKKFSLRKI